MRLRRSFCSVSLLLLGSIVGQGAEFTLFKSVWGDAIVATDTTAAGRTLAPPTREQPVYYQGLTLGRKLGGIPGDKEPDLEQLSSFTARILAQQGYLGAKPGVHEPSLFLVLQWGYLQPGSQDLHWFLGYNPENDIAAPTGPTIGPEVFLRGMRSRETETILEDARHPVYGIIITAFDFKTARTARPVALWQTRIGLPAHGKTMQEALPTMLVAAGPAIGRPADQPVLVDADNARSGTVTFGELKFLDFEDASRPKPSARPPK
jgi:hypothetical protein